MSATFRCTCPMSTRGSIEEAMQASLARGRRAVSVALRPGELPPQVSHQPAHDRIAQDGAREPERAGREDLRAGRRLVVRHLRREAGPEQVRDLGEHVRRRAGRPRRSCRSRSRRSPNVEPSLRPVPAKSHGAASASTHDPRRRGDRRGRCRGTGRRSARPRAGRGRATAASSSSRCRALTTRQKKLFADRNARLPPRSRYRRTTSYSCVVTYSWWPGKTIRS